MFNLIVIQSVMLTVTVSYKICKGYKFDKSALSPQKFMQIFFLSNDYQIF